MSECLLLELQNVAFGPFLQAEQDADAACKNMTHGWMASGGSHTQKGRLDVKVQEKKSFFASSSERRVLGTSCCTKTVKLQTINTSAPSLSIPYFPLRICDLWFVLQPP